MLLLGALCSSMKKVKAHRHTYQEGPWPFPFEDNVGAVTTKFVISGEQPIVEVLHWDDGDWQFMCNTTENPDDGLVVCMGCLFEKYPWISRFKSLKPGCISYLDRESNEWITEELE